MAPRKTAAQRAAEREEAEAETASVEDVSALRYDPKRSGAPEPVVHRKYPYAARSEMIKRLFAAADELGYPRDVVRTTSDGLKYPENIDRYLFPLDYKTEDAADA